jgi:undecaprenyl diphosphate synthase
MISRIPRHVAIIMDGNGRWAKKRLLPRQAGHKVGVETVRTLIKACGEFKIEVLSLFAFSSENWRRPKEEVSWLMGLFVNALQNEVNKLHDNGVRLQVIGEKSAFGSQLQELIAGAEEKTKDNKNLHLIIAANYGGRWDIAQSAKKLAQQVEQGIISSEDINESLLSAHICLADLPPPDLFIRTGGEQRISNFLLWQLAYTELYFTDTLWPDFDRAAFIQALESFGSRQRRFGRTGDQVESDESA